MNRKEILRKFRRAIPQESTNVSMNETLINLLQQNRAKKVGGGRGRGKKLPSGTVAHEEIAQEQQQPGPRRKCNSLTESLNDENSDEKEYDGTTCKICKITWIELTEKCGDWLQCEI